MHGLPDPAILPVPVPVPEPRCAVRIGNRREIQAMTPEDLRAAVTGELLAIAPDLDAATLDPEAHLMDDIGIDSMDFLNLVTALQGRFDRPIPETDFPRLTSVASIARYLAAAGA